MTVPPYVASEPPVQPSHPRPSSQLGSMFVILPSLSYINDPTTGHPDTWVLGPVSDTSVATTATGFPQYGAVEIAAGSTCFATDGTLASVPVFRSDTTSPAGLEAAAYDDSSTCEVYVATNAGCDASSLQAKDSYSAAVTERGGLVFRAADGVLPLTATIISTSQQAVCQVRVECQLASGLEVGGQFDVTVLQPTLGLLVSDWSSDWLYDGGLEFSPVPVTEKRWPAIPSDLGRRFSLPALVLTVTEPSRGAGGVMRLLPTTQARSLQCTAGLRSDGVASGWLLDGVTPSSSQTSLRQAIGGVTRVAFDVSVNGTTRHHQPVNVDLLVRRDLSQPVVIRGATADEDIAASLPSNGSLLVDVQCLGWSDKTIMETPIIIDMALPRMRWVARQSAFGNQTADCATAGLCESKPIHVTASVTDKARYIMPVPLHGLDELFASLPAVNADIGNSSTSLRVNHSTPCTTELVAVRNESVWAPKLVPMVSGQGAQWTLRYEWNEADDRMATVGQPHSFGIEVEPLQAGLTALPSNGLLVQVSLTCTWSQGLAVKESVFVRLHQPAIKWLRGGQVHDRLELPFPASASFSSFDGIAGLSPLNLQGYSLELMVHTGTEIPEPYRVVDRAQASLMPMCYGTAAYTDPGRDSTLLRLVPDTCRDWSWALPGTEGDAFAIHPPSSRLGTGKFEEIQRTRLAFTQGLVKLQRPAPATSMSSFVVNGARSCFQNSRFQHECTNAYRARHLCKRWGTVIDVSAAKPTP